MHLSILESSLLQSRDAIQRSRMLFTDELSHKTSNRLIRSQVLQLKKERCGDQWALVTIVFQVPFDDIGRNTGTLDMSEEHLRI